MEYYELLSVIVLDRTKSEADRYVKNHKRIDLNKSDLLTYAWLRTR